jgi:phosphoglucan,water dikinase
MAARSTMQCGQLGQLGLRGGSNFEGLRRAGVTQSAVKGRRARSGRGRASLAIRCGDGPKVRVRLDHQVQFGEWHAILGSAKSIGAWQEKVPMNWTESGWVADLQGEPGETVEYKHIIVTHDGNVIWEEGPNRTLSLPKEGEVELVTHWGQTQEELHFQGQASQNGHAGKEVEQEEQVQNSEEKLEQAVNETSTSFVKEWQGASVGDRRERSGKWDTSGLDGPAVQIVEGDKSASNWWRKLDVVRDLLSGEVAKKERLKTLVNAAVYLKWINTGQIVCYEDGQHYRPNKHAEISRRIFVELERITGEKTVSLQELLVIQKIHPCLPAFKAEFTASVPLTRIRDIAHRNDIPHDLKQEIKHTIQNKLHRSAGPEDLVATELMLARVTKSPGQYSEAFVNEFRTFYAELKDFFNAGSLTEQLEGLRSSIDEAGLPILDQFLSSKANLDQMRNSNSETVAESVLGTLHALTCLREKLLQGLESGLRNDASDAAIAMRQKWRLSELGLEDYAFVLLSRLINAFESEGGAAWLSEEVKGGRVGAWTPALTSLAMAVQQLGLSGLQREECAAIKNELLAWSATGILANDTKATWALRLKATVDRVRRVAESYTDTVLQLYPDYVEKLGSALGIPENTVRTYTEADIRASVVFQIAKLCSLLLKAIRSTAGGDGFDVIMPGRATGTLVEVDRIVPGSLPSSITGNNIILLVKHADGDEEVKAAGSNVAGVILQHELPHLSHLGVRARQEKVVFVTCDDEERSANLRSLLNSTVELVASPESVHVKLNDTPEAPTQKQDAAVTNSKPQQSKAKSINAGGTVATKQSVVVRSPPGTVLDLSKATTENSGSKAAACGELAVLTAEAEKVSDAAKFLVPKGKVIPFGAMEDALEKSTGSKFQQFKSLLEKVETAALEGGELDSICNELQSLVAAQRPAKQILDKLLDHGFAPDSRLIVRSSANVEDLAGMSGAGLYESIPNVKLSEPESFGRAVAQVWASLYTRRAVLSRRVAGVPQKEASMAVLVQELLSPELSFVLHTVSPIDQDTNVVQAEVAVGLGETLASGTRGTPWRLAAHKFDGTVKTLAFANLSEQMMVKKDDDGAKRNEAAAAADGRVVKAVVDYSSQPLSTDPAFRTHLGQALAAVGFFLEKHFGAPQDVEGCVIGQDVYIVQARPQP